MTKIINQTQNLIFVEKLGFAKTIGERLKGLIGKKQISDTDGLYISRCNSIHTFFMNFPIDAVFVDKNFKVKKICSNIIPNKIVFPVWGARAVVEVQAGLCAKKKMQVGDQLHVVS